MGVSLPSTRAHARALAGRCNVSTSLDLWRRDAPLVGASCAACGLTTAVISIIDDRSCGQANRPWTEPLLKGSTWCDHAVQGALIASDLARVRQASLIVDRSVVVPVVMWPPLAHERTLENKGGTDLELD